MILHDAKIGEWHCVYLGENNGNTLCDFKDKIYANKKEEWILGIDIDNKLSL